MSTKKKNKSLTKKQREAKRALQRTLDGIDSDRSWQRILPGLTAKAEANAKVRFNSYRHGIECPRVLD